jgi:hypothetical protein
MFTLATKNALDQAARAICEEMPEDPEEFERDWKGFDHDALVAGSLEHVVGEASKEITALVSAHGYDAVKAAAKVAIPQYI